MIEIRWHGRGGQGAKTASLFLAEAAFELGKYIQGFPEYGPERMGAPITAYNRISDTPITIHSNIYTPNYVVVVDETLIGPIDVVAGLADDGGLIVNASDDPAAIKTKVVDYGGAIYTIDARSISEEELGRYFPNIPMLGAVVKVTGMMDEEFFVEAMEKSLRHKFKNKPKVVDGNIRVLRRSMEEVKGI